MSSEPHEPPKRSNIGEYVARQIRAARKTCHLTQAQVAERLGCTQTCLSYWESGERDVGLAELADLAVVFRQPLSFFLPPEQPEGASAHELREAAWWVVMNWDLQRSQGGAMPALRRALGLPGEPPTQEEAQARMDAYLNDPTRWGRST